LSRAAASPRVIALRPATWQHRGIRRIIVALCAASFAFALNVAPDALAQTDPGYRTPPPGTEEFTPPPDEFVLPEEEVPVGVEAVEVTATPDPAPSPHALPVTGGDIVGLVGIGAGLVLAGTLVLRLRRRTALSLG
jgi:hypothetical protein